MTDDIDFECQPDEFCMLWRPLKDNSSNVEGNTDKISNGEISNGFATTRGYIRCKLITCGYLRKNFVNPKDITTIIAKYLTDNDKIELIVSNYQSFTILFPSMKQVCINFAKIFNFNKDSEYSWLHHIRFSCGIIGIPQNNKATNNNHFSMKTLYNVIHKRNCIDQIPGWLHNLRYWQVSFNSGKNLEVKNDNNNNNTNGDTTTDNSDDCDEQQFELESVKCVLQRVNRSAVDTVVAHCRGSTRDLLATPWQKSFSNNMFGFNDGDCVVLEYDKDDNTLAIELHCNNSEKQKFEPIVPARTENNKVVLRKGYDYVLACIINGSRKRSSEMNNVYTFSGKHHNSNS